MLRPYIAVSLIFFFLMVSVAATGASSTILFEAAINFDGGDGPVSARPDDFDGDGHFDLAAVNYQSDDVSILINEGDGTFAHAVSYCAGYFPFLDTRGRASTYICLRCGGASREGAGRGSMRTGYIRNRLGWQERERDQSQLRSLLRPDADQGSLCSEKTGAPSMTSVEDGHCPVP
jgi:hypothetical protein